MAMLHDERVVVGLVASASAITLAATALRHRLVAPIADNEPKTFGVGAKILALRYVRAVAAVVLCASSYYTNAALESTNIGQWVLTIVTVSDVCSSRNYLHRDI